MNTKQQELYKAMFANNQELVDSLSNDMEVNEIIEVIYRADAYNHVVDFGFEIALPTRDDVVNQLIENDVREERQQAAMSDLEEREDIELCPCGCRTTVQDIDWEIDTETKECGEKCGDCDCEEQDEVAKTTTFTDKLRKLAENKATWYIAGLIDALGMALLFYLLMKG